MVLVQCGFAPKNYRLWLLCFAGASSPDGQLGKGHLELDGQLPGRVHRVAADPQRRAVPLLREPIRAPRQLFRDQEQTQALHLAPAGTSRCSHDTQECLRHFLKPLFAKNG